MLFYRAQGDNLGVSPLRLGRVQSTLVIRPKVTFPSLDIEKEKLSNDAIISVARSSCHVLQSFDAGGDLSKNLTVIVIYFFSLSVKLDKFYRIMLKPKSPLWEVRV